MTNTNIGIQIKQLRKQKGYTQEKLGEILNVSTQSVSKWERASTYPDISLLPKIATIFGITIDELFSQTIEEDLSKIENMIDSKEELSLIEEGYILQKLEQSEENSITKRLKAKLFLNRGKSYLKLAQNTIKESIELEPINKESHYIFLSTNNGVMTDWNFFNKHDIIEYYKHFVETNPNYPQGYMYLLDHLIHDARLEEATIVLNKYKKLDSTFRVDWYQARINQTNNKLDPLILSFKGDWLQHSIKADEYAKIGEYENAISEYEIAYELQPSPKYLDALECIAHIYEITGKSDLTKECYKKILLTLEEEWNITFGSSYNYYQNKSL